MTISGFLMSLFDLLFGSISRYDWQKCMGRKKFMMNKKRFDIVLICSYDNLILHIVWYDFIIITNRYKMIRKSNPIKFMLLALRFKHR